MYFGILSSLRGIHFTSRRQGRAANQWTSRLGSFDQIGWQMPHFSVPTLPRTDELVLAGPRWISLTITQMPKRASQCLGTFTRCGLDSTQFTSWKVRPQQPRSSSLQGTAQRRQLRHPHLACCIRVKSWATPSSAFSMLHSSSDEKASGIEDACTPLFARPISHIHGCARHGIYGISHTLHTRSCTCSVVNFSATGSSCFRF
mmetsp:Transcript_19557/g.42216  ORF Transcript_19557/g.42216 Transcript_19557/m.42216 type:complete len:202 (+) Transcript_19557:264-869(+)